MGEALGHPAHLCHHDYMDTTIRNLDERAYRAIKARAALEGRTIGQVVTAAIEAYVARPGPHHRRVSLRAAWKATDYPAGCERLSEEIDPLLHGAT